MSFRFLAKSADPYPVDLANSIRPKPSLSLTRVALTGVSLVALGALVFKYIRRSKFRDAHRWSKEEALLKYVFAHAIEGNVDSVINTIDQYGHGEQWMMNVGDVKGLILDAELKMKQPKIAVELGAYVGYSALRIARALPADGHLYSIEIDALNAAIATKIVEFAGLKDKVTIIVGTVTTKITALKEQYGIDHIDLLFLDHLKTEYKPDLILLEKNGFIQSGTVLVADNCLFPGCPDYVEYVSTNPNYVSVKHETELEYDPTIKDHVWVSTRK